MVDLVLSPETSYTKRLENNNATSHPNNNTSPTNFGQQRTSRHIGVSLLKQTLLGWRGQAAAYLNRRVYGVGIMCWNRIFTKYNISYGQLLLVLPLLACTAISIYFTFPRPNTAQSGNYAYYALMYSYLLAHKQASLFQLVGLSWEQLVGLHQMASITALALAALHGYVAFTAHDYIPCREPTEENLLDTASTVPFCEDLDSYLNGTTRRDLGELRLEDNPRFRHSLVGIDTNLWLFLWDGGRNVSGSWMFSLLLATLLLSNFRTTLRGPYFDLWLVLHIAGAGAIIAYADKHRVQLFIVLAIWWGLDGLLRYGLGSILRLPKTATLTFLSKKPSEEAYEGDLKRMKDDPNAIVELTFDKKFNYEPGQYIRVAVMETCQPVMFHPITISSAPYQDQVTLHFRPFGGWTNQLARMAAKRPSKKSSNDYEPTDACKVHVLVEGPYGNLSMNLWNDHCRYPVVVLIAGGIGITPMSSIARQLLHEHNNAGRQRKQICVVWAVRDLAMVEALPLLGPGNKNTMPKKSNTKKKKKCNKALNEFFPFGPSYESSRDTVLKAKIFLTTKITTDESNPGKMKRTKFLDEFFVDESFMSSAVLPASEGSVISSPSIITTQESMDNIEILATPMDRGYSFHSGRPDIKSILTDAAAFVESDERVAVIACGPYSLVQAAKVASAELTCGGSSTSFDFHEEVFLY